MQLSGGPFTYNRFNSFEQSLKEGSKPDFLDMDGDGNKKEPMKKAIKEKGKKDVKEGNCYQQGGKVEDKKEKSPCEKCKEEGKKDCNCDEDKKKEDKKPAFLQKEGVADVAQKVAGSTAKFGKGLSDTAVNSAKAVGGAMKNLHKGVSGGAKAFNKEEVIQALIDGGLANNPVSAEIIAEHMSDEWKAHITEQLG